MGKWLGNKNFQTGKVLLAKRMTLLLKGEGGRERGKGKGESAHSCPRAIHIYFINESVRL